MSWHSIDISITELCIDTTLRCGQSFRWKQSSPQEYSCAIHGRLITLKQDASKLYYKVTFPTIIRNESIDPVDAPILTRTESGQKEFELQETQRFLKHYLNLEPNLEALYTCWSEKDKNFAKKAPKFHGVRILKQDAWESLVGFICSSCNNIKRISQMMDKLCANYGPLIGYIDDVPYYDMPSPAALVNPRVEAHLRELGFGYRAAYLYQTAQMIARESNGWLDSLRNPESPVFGHKAMPAGQMQPEGREGYIKAHTALMELQGVGAKVADCVCLFGLGWGEAVPVDTHVWQIAQRDYGFGRGKHRSLTKATYDAVANYFRDLWGKEAGWAHSVLFTADLKTFAEKAAANVVKLEEAMDPVKMETDAESVSTNGLEDGRMVWADIPTMSIKQEMASLHDGDVNSGAPSRSDANSRGASIKDEVKREAVEDIKTADVSNGEDAGVVLKSERIEIVTPTVTNKRRVTGHIKQEGSNVKTELVERTIKRRKSDRLNK